jgi:drug/metabolite transporter (DMT)-like permease
MRNPTLDKLIWVLIFGGLLFVSLGLFVEDRDVALGWGMVLGGALATAAGGVLIVVRSRRADD